ncbi:MAG: rod shape-determining protein RodA [Lachnospiraceae bacterium]|nr:rod shape-determining protein RodA [Lachnospiraceae bacterium]
MLGTVRENRIHIRNLDFGLILVVLALSVIGVLMVHSATVNEKTASLVSTTVKQIMGVGAGFVIMIALAFIDYRKMTKYAWVLYIVVMLGLIYVRFFTAAIYGAHRWIYFPLLGTIQPSEFSKPVMVLALALVIHKLEENISKPLGLFLFLLAAAPIVVLVFIEPDLSTTLVLLYIIVSVLFLGGISYKWVVGVLVLLIPAAVVFMIAVYQPEQPILHWLFKDHQVERINAFFFPELYPNTVYQQTTSVMAIGSGGLWGKGLNNSSLYSVKNGNFLSEESSDFIFAVVGEELGFVGVIVLFLLYAVLVFESLRISRHCNDLMGKIIAAACGTTIGVQAMINIGVATLLIPNTGIPLPFVSAGLSSLLSTFIMMGLVLSCGMYGRIQQRVFY